MTPPLPCAATPLNMLMTTCGARRMTFDFQSRPVGCHREQTPGFRIITVQGFSHESRTGQGKSGPVSTSKDQLRLCVTHLHASCQYMDPARDSFKKILNLLNYFFRRAPEVWIGVRVAGHFRRVERFGHSWEGIAMARCVNLNRPVYGTVLNARSGSPVSPVARAPSQFRVTNVDCRADGRRLDLVSRSGGGAWQPGDCARTWIEPVKPN